MASWLVLPFEVKQLVITHWLESSIRNQRRPGDPVENVWGASIRYSAQRALWRSLRGFIDVAPEMKHEIVKLIHHTWQLRTRDMADWVVMQQETLGVQGGHEEHLWRRLDEAGKHRYVVLTDERDILYNVLRLLAMTASHRRRIYGPGFDGLYYASEMRELGLYWDNKKAELIEVIDGEAYTTGDGKSIKLGKVSL